VYVVVQGGKAMMMTRRKHERRWRDAGFFLLERRDGDVWRYGSIAVCVALWAIVGWLTL